MLPPEGWRLDTELRSPAFNKTKSGPAWTTRGQAVSRLVGRPVLRAPGPFVWRALVLVVVSLMLMAIACSGSGSGPSRLSQQYSGTLTVEPFPFGPPPVNSPNPPTYFHTYPVSLSAPGSITVTVTSISPTLQSNYSLAVAIGVPDSSSVFRCREDVHLQIFGEAAQLNPSPDYTMTLPASLTRTSPAAGSYCVWVANGTPADETYTLTIATQ
jgi:hypothetical protein